MQRRCEGVDGERRPPGAQWSRRGGDTRDTSTLRRHWEDTSALPSVRLTALSCCEMLQLSPRTRGFTPASVYPGFKHLSCLLDLLGVGRSEVQLSSADPEKTLFQISRSV
ncbi:hypothetical protein NHX12_023216 [Muraenolepis orangiensis]|uniref:Uncharacterized protein n=1 Tax=Muraenolepis orangiensis TaxID=630683 RepID=A0A9Q0EJM1_9TELE|nr:hypothetical protein NHX12_023216 [Muraenolepis orangiensis]